jgi:hypothetical protein
MEGRTRAHRGWTCSRAAALAAVSVLALTGVLAPGAQAAGARAPCPAFCAHSGGPEIVGFAQRHGEVVRLTLLLRARGSFELVLNRSLGGHLVPAAPTLLDSTPREVLAGSLPTGGRPVSITPLPLGRVAAGAHALTLSLAGPRRSLPPGIYVLRVFSLTAAGRVRNRGAAIVLRRARNGHFTPLLEPQDLPPPSTSTAAAGAITPSTATLSGQVDPGGLLTSYYFQYGTSTSYGEQTPVESAGAGTAALPVSASLAGLTSQSTYHVRLIASQCGGCAWGTAHGPDMTFTTPPTPQQIAATRAIATYQAMQQYFYAANVYPADTSSLYATDYPHTGATYASLWPFSRALVGTITLAGVPPALLGGSSYQSDVADRLLGLSRYWDESGSGPGYDSTPVPPYGSGGAKYYDDQAWVGLALAQDYRITGDQTALADAQNVWSFVYPGGSGASESFEPGGIFWTQQGVGAGLSNHDRTTTSTAPNAELALLLAQADPAEAPVEQSAASALYAWLEHYLYNVQGNPADPNPNFDAAQPPLMFDKLKGDDTVDRTLRSYNQGAMIALAVREYQQTGQSSDLAEAEAIAASALDTFTESYYVDDQPAAFDAIFFRGLLVLYSVTEDQALRTRIMQTIETYAQDAWNNYRAPDGLFRFPSTSGAGDQLLDQGAMLEIYAALAWDPRDYGELP